MALYYFTGYESIFPSLRQINRNKYDALYYDIELYTFFGKLTISISFTLMSTLSNHTHPLAHSFKILWISMQNFVARF